MALLGPGIQTLDYCVEKGFDKVPNHIFSTKKERREWERQEREKQRAERRQHEIEEQSAEEQHDKKQHRRSRSDAGAPRHRDSPPPDFFTPPPPPSQRRRDYNSSLPTAAAAGAATGFAADSAYNAYDPRHPRNMQSESGYGYQPPGQDDRRSYNPSDYQPRGDYDNRVGYRRDDQKSSYGDSYGGRASSSGARRSGRYSDEEDDYDDDRHRRRHRDRDASEEGTRGKIANHFDKSEHGLATGALGALAGGVLGHEVGRGKGIWPTVAGVVIGGLGANALEARHEKKKHRDDGRSRSVDAGKHAFRSYEDDRGDYEDRQDRRSSRRDPSEYDDRRSAYDDRRSNDRYDR